ncbi:MAG: hypothetical protein KC506_01015 [Nanoarchaeota archaeon]|nr:hypothetical protein [Nanoarchaeota archaeon]
MKSKFIDLAQHKLLILIGAIISLGTLFKLLGFYNISSDWFWFIAGLALMVEGLISLAKQKQFDRKYKIITKEEYQLLKKPN